MAKPAIKWFFLPWYHNPTNQGRSVAPKVPARMG